MAFSIDGRCPRVNILGCWSGKGGGFAWDGSGKSVVRRAARHWQQTDCWYYTPLGTKTRVPLLDEIGKQIRGKDNRPAAELALARVKVSGQWRPTAEPTASRFKRVSSEATKAMVTDAVRIAGLVKAVKSGNWRKPRNPARLSASGI